MKKLENYTLDNRATRINTTNFANWWILQQLFAYPPFEEFFDSDKLIEYYEEFSNGGIYQLEINVDNSELWIPVGLLSWHPMVPDSHPVRFDANEKVAYISDSITYIAYQHKGVQTNLFDYTFSVMRNQGYTTVYLRTSPNSKMYFLAQKLGFKLFPDVTQDVESLRVGSILKTDKRIFFYRKL